MTDQLKDLVLELKVMKLGIAVFASVRTRVTESSDGQPETFSANVGVAWVPDFATPKRMLPVILTGPAGVEEAFISQIVT